MRRSLRFSVKAAYLAWSLVLSFCGAPVWGHESHSHGNHDATGPYPIVQKEFGVAGNPKRLTRTIVIDMLDSMRFAPASIAVKQGDTIRFVLRNQGRMPHEWMLGTAKELQDHAVLMGVCTANNNTKVLDEAHNQVHIVNVEPGKVQQIVWNFNRAGAFEFACLIPGHYEAGMVGSIVVQP